MYYDCLEDWPPRLTIVLYFAIDLLVFTLTKPGGPSYFESKAHPIPSNNNAKIQETKYSKTEYSIHPRFPEPEPEKFWKSTECRQMLDLNKHCWNHTDNSAEPPALRPLELDHENLCRTRNNFHPRNANTKKENHQDLVSRHEWLDRNVQ